MLQPWSWLRACAWGQAQEERGGSSVPPWNRWIRRAVPEPALSQAIEQTEVSNAGRERPLARPSASGSSVRKAALEAPRPHMAGALESPRAPLYNEGVLQALTFPLPELRAALGPKIGLVAGLGNRSAHGSKCSQVLAPPFSTRGTQTQARLAGSGRWSSQRQAFAGKGRKSYGEALEGHGFICSPWDWRRPGPICPSKGCDILRLGSAIWL